MCAMQSLFGSFVLIALELRSYFRSSFGLLSIVAYQFTVLATAAAGVKVSVPEWR